MANAGHARVYDVVGRASQNVRDDLKPIVVPVSYLVLKPFRSYRRRSMYEA